MQRFTWAEGGDAPDLAHLPLDAQALRLVGGALFRCHQALGLAGAGTSEEALMRTQLGAAHDALAWFRILEGLGLAPLSVVPTLNGALALLCVQVEPFDARLIPEEPAPGDPAELRVRAGLTFENATGAPTSVVLAAPITVAVTESGVDAPIDDGPTDALGIFSATFRRDGTPPIAIGVQACIDDPAFPLLRIVCAGAAFSTPTTTTTSSSTTTSLGATTTTLPGPGGDVLSGTITMSLAFDRVQGVQSLHIQANVSAFVRVRGHTDGRVDVLAASGSGTREESFTDDFGCSGEQGLVVSTLELTTTIDGTITGATLTSVNPGSVRLDLLGSATQTREVADTDTCPIGEGTPRTEEVPVARLYDFGSPGVLGDLVFAAGSGLAAIDFNAVQTNALGIQRVTTGVLLPEP